VKTERTRKNRADQTFVDHGEGEQHLVEDKYVGRRSFNLRKKSQRRRNETVGKLGVKGVHTNLLLLFALVLEKEIEELQAGLGV